MGEFEEEIGELLLLMDKLSTRIEKKQGIWMSNEFKMDAVKEFYYHLQRGCHDIASRDNFHENISLYFSHVLQGFNNE